MSKLTLHVAASSQLSGLVLRTRSAVRRSVGLLSVVCHTAENKTHIRNNSNTTVTRPIPNSKTRQVAVASTNQLETQVMTMQIVDKAAAPADPAPLLAFALETATLPQLREMDRLGSAAWYDAALRLAREEKWAAARRVFQALTKRYPNLCRAWVSWAQMEKRANAVKVENSNKIMPNYASCRAILQQGLSRNPNSSCLCQAWGLLELQKGNSFPAVKLIDRSAQYDPKCIPVQKWKLYKDARNSMLTGRMSA